MPKDKVEPLPARIVLECPNCHGTMFQGPIERGEIVNGTFVPRERLWHCVTCHKESGEHELPERVPLAA